MSLPQIAKKKLQHTRRTRMSRASSIVDQDNDYDFTEHDVFDDLEDMAGDVSTCTGRSLPEHSDRNQPWASETLGVNLNSDTFRKKVKLKSRLFLVGEREAELDVIVDLLIAQEGCKDRCLLRVVKELHTTNKLHLMVSMLLQQGAKPHYEDEAGQTPLHHAVRRGLELVCQRLLDNGARPAARDASGVTPYHIALQQHDDDIASLLLVYMANAKARSLYSCHKNTPAEFSFHALVVSPMQKTVQALLDCMLDVDSMLGAVTVRYTVLEADEQGFPPDHAHFHPHSPSSLSIIAQTSNKAVVYHDVVRLLIRRKWKEYAKWRFQLNAAFYLLTLFSLTFSAVVASDAADPRRYDAALQYARAVCEVLAFGVAGAVTVLIELNKMRTIGLRYWKDMFNCLDLASSVLLVLVILFRYLDRNEQWPCFSVGYLLWTFRTFKYAAVFRSTGAYAQILWKTLSQDFIQFAAVFAIVLLAFSGSFLLAARGEGSLDNNSDTRSFWIILFAGARTLVEAQPVVEYTGEDSYSGLGTFLMVMYLLSCIVVLLNILIAQLSDTYQNIQGDAQRRLALNRAWIISRVELKSGLIGKGFRVTEYLPQEIISDLEGVLERWDNDVHHDNIKTLTDIRDKLDIQDLNMRTLKARLAKQQMALLKLRNQQHEMLSLLRFQNHHNQMSDPNCNGREPSDSRRTRRVTL